MEHFESAALFLLRRAEKHSESPTDGPPCNALSLKSICHLPFVLPYPFSCTLSSIYFSSGLQYHFHPPSTHKKLLHPQTETLTLFVERSEALASCEAFCRFSKQVTHIALFLLLLLTVSQTWISQSAPCCLRGGSSLHHQQRLCVSHPCFCLFTTCSTLCPDACLETDLEINSAWLELHYLSLPYRRH